MLICRSKDLHFCLYSFQSCLIAEESVQVEIECIFFIKVTSVVTMIQSAMAATVYLFHTTKMLWLRARRYFSSSVSLVGLAEPSISRQMMKDVAETLISQMDRSVWKPALNLLPQKRIYQVSLYVPEIFY